MKDWGTSTPVVFAVAVGILLSAGPVDAQSVVRVEAGASSASGAYGLRAEWHHRRFDGWIGVTGSDRLGLGGQLHTRWRGLDVTGGDQWLRHDLPTDRFGGGWSLLGRGLAVADSTGQFQWMAFGGQSARALSLAPGVVTARGRELLGMVELRWRRPAGTEWGARHSATPAGTSHLAFASWTREELRLDASAGRIQDEGYGSLAATVRNEVLDLDLSWTDPTTSGRRVATRALGQPELTGLNGRIGWRPSRGWYLSAGRVQRRPSPFLPDTTPVRTIWDASMAAPVGSALSVRIGGYASPGTAGERASYGLNTGLAGSATDGVRGAASLFLSRSPAGGTSSLAALSVYERIRPGLEILQRVTWAGSGTPDLSLGGRYVRGATRIGIDYRTEFVPSTEGSQFRTALVLDVRVALSPTTELSVATYLDSSGRASYRARSGRWFYPGGPAAAGRSRDPAAQYVFDEWVVRGRVVLEDDTPVEGAALRIGERTVYTDARGRFLLRTDEERVFDLEVLLQEFLLDRLYRVLDAPETVTSTREADAGEVVVVLEQILRREASGGG